MSITSRHLALRELARLRQNGDEVYSACLDRIQDENLADARERALAERIFTGTYQNISYLDYVLARFCRGKYNSLHPLTKDILRLSAYQIIYLDRIPSRAAVNEGVSLARKKVNQGAAGLVNAVLRKVSDSVSELPLPAGEGTAEYLSVLYSHPVWLANTLINRIGYDKTADFFRLDNQPADITIHINTVKAQPAEIFAALSSAGCEYSLCCGLDNCFTVSHLDNCVRSLLSEGKCYVQDLSAFMCAYAAAPQPGDTVIDACAAPGGKSFSAAVMMGGKGRIYSSDLSKHRLERMQQAVERLGFNEIITCSCLDASDPVAYAGINADVVIVDAPCSGFGTIRKKPEIRAKKHEEITHLHDIQIAILNNCAKSVKQGGTLIYSTCTVFTEENEDVVSSFLVANPDFRVEDFTLPAPFGSSVQGMMTIWPWVANSDGFFIAKFRRK